MRGARWLVDSLRAKQEVDKSLGQHYLISDELISRAVELAEVNSDDHFLEIGPGPGVLTEVLLDTGCRLTAIEIDEGAVEHLSGIFAAEIKSGQLNLISGDALISAWPKDLSKVVANIPYQISSPLIELLTRNLRNPHTEEISDVVVLVQEEFAERLVMEYESDVGSLGMTALLDWNSEIEDKVAPHHFSPNPKVHSRYIHMTPQQEEFPCDKRLVRLLIHAGFAERRKKLRSTLKRVPKRLNRLPEWHAVRWKAAYSAFIEDERMDARPEEFEFDDWLELATDFASFGEEE